MGGLKADWLTQLAPAHAPPPAGWWPLAPGWWIVALVLILAIGALAYWQTRPTKRLQRVALRELAALNDAQHDDLALARDIENLLRRYAIARFGRESVAPLAGQGWIDFIVAHGGHVFAGTAGANLLRAAYGGQYEADRDRWLNGARTFLKWRK